MCKFCFNDLHTAECPRDTPGAEERFDEGRRHGNPRAYREPASSDLAYMAGYFWGDFLAEEGARLAELEATLEKTA